MNDIDGIYQLSNVSYVPITALCALLVMPHFIPLTTLQSRYYLKFRDAEVERTEG